MHNYILGSDGRTPEPCSDIRTWALWFESAKRHVALTERDGVSVSTVFLGIDHNFLGKGPPILFETMVFGGEHDEDQQRYSTWDEAEAGHKEVCKKVWP